MEKKRKYIIGFTSLCFWVIWLNLCQRSTGWEIFQPAALQSNNLQGWAYYYSTAQNFSLNGTVILSDPINCCSPTNTDEFAGNIVLIEKGGACYFEHKVCPSNSFFK